MSKITILQSQPTRAGDPAPRLTKTFTATGVNSYDSALYFAAHSHDVDNIVELSDLLTMLEPMADCCIVRGHVTASADPSYMRRLLHATHDSAATLKEAPQHFFLADFDKVPADPNLTPQERLDFLVGLLPEYFHDASFHFRWSASAGTKGWDTLSCHLWFWLDRPWVSEPLRERIRLEAGWEDVDTAPFSAVQIHYTAAPIFEPNITDPLIGQQRSGLVRKSSDVVAMPDFIKPMPSNAVIQHRRAQSTGDRFQALLAEIGPNYHEPIRHCIAFYVRSNRHQIDRTELKDKIINAIQMAPYGKNSKSNYTDNRYLDRLIDGAIRKFS